ncbi:ribosome hibernation-promoting factor, HPF/YfiA family [Rickettsiales endosymbiont of Trichoplax sp. H2]|uniref:ribosome hibernation-promoting factor, HPF/YfiA family n=1 Tax=Rickettsiales endosymbiont of Trichoplax sp. H2 TaxID=2021221 RepID=UPI0012B340A2|nr:ribosome-associated translation inhibitor RaiA [Rickettsiales endosymbiont of Trichoplax sp. H2]MSO14228.1 Ribosome hibernation promotion factor [Rickettsiales endosymbiont of Trichoplax sp. H2]
MEITVYGKHIKVGASLEKHVKDHLIYTVKKYFKDALNAHVKIEKQGQLFQTEIIVNEGTGNGILIKSNGHEYDSYRSFNVVNEKIEKQLRRYKNRIKNHKVTKESESDLISGTKYVISPLEEEDIENIEKSPTIIAEKVSGIENLSVKDAVMKMDLLNLPALLFINDASKKLNLVYYRKDGNISWIDTKVNIN